MIIYMMRIYNYITTFLFPHTLLKKKTVQFSKSSITLDNMIVKHEIMDRCLDNYENTQYIQQFKQPFTHVDTNKKARKKSPSWSPKSYYCGHCSKYIQVPVYLYLDKVYCTTICRTKQYKLDLSSNIVREKHSLSV
jgi:hypothetical protein